MKRYKINKDETIDFLILAINSHSKPYKLCWKINKNLKYQFIKTKNHKHPNNSNQTFERFKYYKQETETQYNLISNISNEGYLEPNNKSINYFFLAQGGIYNSKKIIESLTKIDEIMLVFELNLSKIKTITPFIIND